MQFEAIKVFGPDIGGIVYKCMHCVHIHDIIDHITHEFDKLVCWMHHDVDNTGYCEGDYSPNTIIKLNAHADLWRSILCEMTTIKKYIDNDINGRNYTHMIYWKSHRFLVYYDKKYHGYLLNLNLQFIF